RPGVARGADPGGPAEPTDLEAGILPEHPYVGLADHASEPGLGARVLVEGQAGLLRHRVHVERLDLPARQELTQLAQLVIVLRGESDAYSRHLGRRWQRSLASGAETVQVSTGRRRARRILSQAVPDGSAAAPRAAVSPAARSARFIRPNGLRLPRRVAIALRRARGRRRPVGAAPEFEARGPRVPPRAGYGVHAHAVLRGQQGPVRVAAPASDRSRANLPPADDAP